MADGKLVTCDDFDRAETDRYFKRYAGLGGFGKLFHVRQPTPIDKQDVIRMNRDTIYSVGIIDLTSPVTVVKPDSGGRFQSLMPLDQDHYCLHVEHGSGEFTFTQEQVGTRYMALVFRTFADARDPDDIAAANALQDAIKVEQADAGSFQVPEWDQESLTKVRDAYNVLAATKSDLSDLFGMRGQVDRLNHMLGTAYGWGGNPKEAASYVNVVPERNDGETAYVLTVADVPVDGFWSVTVYDKDGFMQPNDLGAYDYNNVTATKNADGSVTIHFGGDPNAANYLPITPGWNYAVRLYQPRKEILDGTWTFPEPEVA